jgi:hypothetical protein
MRFVHLSLSLPGLWRSVRFYVEFSLFHQNGSAVDVTRRALRLSYEEVVEEPTKVDLLNINYHDFSLT